MIDLLVPFQLPFMQQALGITLLIAVPMALLSCYLVLQGWSLMGDAISHAVLPGIIIAHFAALPIAFGAFLAGLACTVSAGFVSRNSRIKSDTALGIVFSGMFGLGLVLFVALPTNLHLDHILFGDMLGVLWRDIGQTAIIALLVTGFVAVLRKDLLLTAFDEQHARAIGIRTGLIRYALLTAVALMVVAALKAVGIILAIAFLVTPGAVAFLVTRRFAAMMTVSVLVSAFSTVLGIYLSFWFDSAPAATIVVVMAVIFAIAFANAARQPLVFSPTD